MYIKNYITPSKQYKDKTTCKNNPLAQFKTVERKKKRSLLYYQTVQV